MRRVQGVWDLMEQGEFKPSLGVFDALINAYGGANQLQKIADIFAVMKVLAGLDHTPNPSLCHHPMPHYTDRQCRASGPRTVFDRPDCPTGFRKRGATYQTGPAQDSPPRYMTDRDQRDEATILCDCCRGPPPPPVWLLEAPVRKIILQMYTAARTSQCWSRQTRHGLGVCIWMHLVTGTGNSPSPGQPTPGVVKQDKSSRGSVDTTKTRSGPQRVRMSSGERPIGAAKGKQSDTEALCQPPPPPRVGPDTEQ